ESHGAPGRGGHLRRSALRPGCCHDGFAGRRSNGSMRGRTRLAAASVAGAGPAAGSPRNVRAGAGRVVRARAGTRKDRDAARAERCTLPTELAALATGVTEATIRKWVSRGKLTRYGSPGRAEYDVDELLRLAHGGPLTAPASGE